MTGQRSTTWQDARRLSFEATVPLPPERVALGDAVGRVLARDVAALVELPHYSSSAMDGWAVAGDGPWRIVMAMELASGQAAPILTGGLIPAGTRGIVRSENATTADGILTLGEKASPGEPHPGQHIRRAGEEAAINEVVISAGAVLNPAHIALAAVCGHDTLSVVPEPRVSLLLTGSEVVEFGMPAPGQVRDTFGPQLPAFVRLLGGQVISADRIADDLASTIAALSGATNPADVMITTGGTGGSTSDQLRPALAALGARMIVDGVAMRPGGPTMLAELPAARSGTRRLVLCLPGNPLAAMMGMLTVAHPLLAALGGRAMPPVACVTVTEDVAGRAGTTLLNPSSVVAGVARANSWNGSGMLRGLAGADAVLVVPPEGIRAGESGQVIPLPWIGAF